MTVPDNKSHAANDLSSSSTSPTSSNTNLKNKKLLNKNKNKIIPNNSKENDKNDNKDNDKSSSLIKHYPKYRPNNRVSAPINIPWKRRLQTLFLFFQVSSIILLPGLFVLLWTFPPFWPLLIIYLLFFYFNDKSPSNGKSSQRVSMFIKNSPILKNFTNYFPITLIKSFELKPTFTNIEIDSQNFKFPFNYLPYFFSNLLFNLKLINKINYKIKKDVRTGPRYIFGYHPHGVIGMGAIGAFASEGANFSKIFPGIKIFLLTIINNFQIPFYRDYLMSISVSSVSKKNIIALMKQDLSVVIVVGGAAESLLSKPGNNDIILKKRKGFIKVALELCNKSNSINSKDDLIKFNKDNDICVVPVYGFGETSVYDVYDTNDIDNNSTKSENYFKACMKWLQLWMKKNIGFTIPLFLARGVFNYDFGLLPFRRPINVVVGKPIPIYRFANNNKEKGNTNNKDPESFGEVTQEEIDYFHNLYVEGLIKLFHDNKEKYSTSEFDRDLRIVE
ncbi:hypothetical protein B5S31_g5390 [[Candida] boidinii]|nr:hypothetical protein B5S29_g5371 [[Candida] boidinii]OWB75482.1 hypothetical protein B5S31_g5390 [[Candida] boidinii]